MDYSTKDMGIQNHQTRSILTALQAQTEALTEAMTKALSAMMASGGTTSKGPQPYMGASKES